MRFDPVSYSAVGALANTGRVVYLSAAHTVSLATDKAAHNGCGILNEAATAAGQKVSVSQIGEAWAVAGDTLTPGTHFWLTWDAEGRVIPAATGDNKIGYFIGDAAAVVGQRVRIFVLPGTEL